MGISGPLIVFPLLVLSGLAIIVGSGLQTTNGATPFCASTTYLTCSQSNGSGGTTAGTTYTCAANAPTGCNLPYNCPSPNNVPAGTFCNFFDCVNPLPPPIACGNNGVWQLEQGHSLLIPNSMTSSLGPLTPNAQSSQSSLVFGGITSEGLVIMVSIAVGVIIFASLTFLGSGENTEGTHITFEAGLLIALWTIISAIALPFFSNLDTFLLGLGTLSYIVLTLFYVLGIVGTISRSAGGGGGV